MACELSDQNDAQMPITLCFNGHFDALMLTKTTKWTLSHHQQKMFRLENTL